MRGIIIMEQDKGDRSAEGERYLNMLGLGEYADRQIPGRAELGRDFLSICGDQAERMLKGFESISPEDPIYNKFREMLRGKLITYWDNEKK